MWAGIARVALRNYNLGPLESQYGFYYETPDGRRLYAGLQRDEIWEWEALIKRPEVVYVVVSSLSLSDGLETFQANVIAALSRLGGMPLTKAVRVALGAIMTRGGLTYGKPSFYPRSELDAFRNYLTGLPCFECPSQAAALHQLALVQLEVPRNRYLSQLLSLTVDPQVKRSYSQDWYLSVGHRALLGRQWMGGWSSDDQPRPPKLVSTRCLVAPGRNYKADLKVLLEDYLLPYGKTFIGTHPVPIDRGGVELLPQLLALSRYPAAWLDRHLFQEEAGSLRMWSQALAACGRRDSQGRLLGLGSQPDSGLVIQALIAGANLLQKYQHDQLLVEQLQQLQQLVAVDPTQGWVADAQGRPDPEASCWWVLYRSGFNPYQDVVPGWKLHKQHGTKL